jgi:flagellar assembly protein FliH
MTSMSSNEAVQPYAIPIDALMYRDVNGTDDSFGVDLQELAETSKADLNTRSIEEIDTLIQAARVEAALETERRIKKECGDAIEAEVAKVVRTIETFQEERMSYFQRVESEVVHLALAIAAKILHREAQVDTMLVAGLVHVAIEKLQHGSSVSIRVAPSNAEAWKRHFDVLESDSVIQVIADDAVSTSDCVLEAAIGSANFSIDAQLKEIERGFFDLLAQRPPIR